MGFMGIQCIGVSDCTADFMGKLVDDILPKIKKQLYVTTNKYNTPGYIDVCLVLKSLITEDSEFNFLYGEWQTEIWEPLLKIMDERKEQWNHLKEDYKILHDFVIEMNNKSKEINN